MNKNKIIFTYCCDYADYRGEGILANNFIKLIKKNLFKKIIIIKPSTFGIKKRKAKKLNHGFYFKYFSPLQGIIKIWFYHLKGYQTCYVNFLPLWNFFLFALLPKKTIFGPITGGNYHGEDGTLWQIIRKRVILIFYSISVLFIKLKKRKCIFATQLLENYLPINIKENSLFNFQIYNQKFYQDKKKNIDILFYNRNYFTKKNKKLIDILFRLSKDFNIKIIGHKLEKFRNIGIISRKETIQHLMKTRLIFSSPENLLSFFTLDAISCGAKVICTSNQKINFFKESYIYQKKLNENLIKNILKKKYISKIKNKYSKDIRIEEKKINSFMLKNYEN